MSPLRRTLDYAQAILIVAMAWLVRSLLSPTLGYTGTGFSMFFLAVMLSTWLGGRGPGVLALLLSLIVCAWFYVLPHTSSLMTAGVQMTIFIFVSSCIVKIVDAMHAARQHVIALNRHIAEQNARLERERDRFRVTLSSIGDAVITTGLNGHIDYMNPVAESLTGQRLTDSQGEPFNSVVKLARDNGQGLASVEPTPNTAGQALPLVDLAIVAGDTLVPVDGNAAPLRAADGSAVGTVYVFRDATARKNFEATLRETDQRKDEFLAVLAHELRNPLAPIQNAAALLQHSGAPLGKQGTWAIDVIQRQLRQMVRLVNDLLDIARINRGKLELQREFLPLNDILHQAIEGSRILIDAAGHELQLDLAAGAVIVHADKARTTQLFGNLLNNAAQYTPPGGRITVSTRLLGDQVEVTVSDTGIGIEPQALSKVFQMFTRADLQGRHHSGLGVGLGLAKTLTELHGGTISARSEGAGRGSAFVVSLPLTQAAAGMQPNSPAATQNAELPRRRVLVVDDNIDAANSLAELLRFSGHMVQVAYDPFVALQVYGQFKPETLILDIGLPGMDGYELARRLRAQKLPQLAQIVALTGWGRPEDIEKALEAGFDRHLTKPIMPEQLEDIMRPVPAHGPD